MECTYTNTHTHTYTLCVCVHTCSVSQSRPTLCNPMDCSLPGSSVQGILQARILEWVAVPFSRGSSQPRDWAHVSCIGKQILYHLNHLGSPVFYNEHIMRLKVYWKSIFPPSLIKLVLVCLCFILIGMSFFFFWKRLCPAPSLLSQYDLLSLHI